MHSTAAETFFSWFAPALLTALLGFTVSAGTFMQAAVSDARTEQPQAVHSERLFEDLVTALALWARSVSEQAGGTNASPAHGDAGAAAYASAAIDLQSALLQSPFGAKSRLLLERVIEDRADVAAARDFVVQLKMAGEIKRAEAEYETRLQPAIARLLRDAELLKSDLRKATDSIGHQQYETADRAARAMQVATALGLVALMLAVAAPRLTARASVKVRGAEQEPLADHPAAALAAQALLQRALRAKPLRDSAAQAGSGIRHTAGADS